MHAPTAYRLTTKNAINVTWSNPVYPENGGAEVTEYGF